MKTRFLTVLFVVSMLVVGLLPLSTAYAADCQWHVVKRGENLTQIARRYGVSLSTVVGANNISNPSRIFRGQRICIPKSGSQQPPSDCTRVHVVKRGEYLKLIAGRYGVTVASITKANKIKNANRIYTGQRLTISVPCAEPQPKPKPQPQPQPQPMPPSAAPWKGEFWDNPDLRGSPRFVRDTSAIRFLWGLGGPQDLARDNFSVRWTRTMYFGEGRYLFHVKVDDGVRLWVDGDLLVNEWHDTAQVNYTAEKQLSAGNHAVRLEYYEHLGGAQITLQIDRLGPLPPPPPPSPPAGQWHGEYFDNKNLQGSPAWTASSRDLNFEWGTGSPKAGIGADNFSARWTGEFHFGAGTYRFYATADDGIRVFLDGDLIIDEWHNTSRTTYWEDRGVAEGKHTVKVEYYENTGVAVAKLVWSRR